jgi:hypothetical protein
MRSLTLFHGFLLLRNFADNDAYSPALNNIVRNSA